MATPPKVSANTRPLAGAAGTVKATKPPRVGAAKGRRVRADPTAQTTNGKGGSSATWADIPD